MSAPVAQRLCDPRRWGKLRLSGFTATEVAALLERRYPLEKADQSRPPRSAGSSARQRARHASWKRCRRGCCSPSRRSGGWRTGVPG